MQTLKKCNLDLLAQKGDFGSFTSCAPEGIGQPVSLASSMVTGNTLNITGLAKCVSGFLDRGATITGGGGKVPSFTLWSASLKKNVYPTLDLIGWH